MQNIKLKATQGLDLQATTQLKAEGKLSAELSGAQAKVSGTAMTEISAPLVKIN